MTQPPDRTIRELVNDLYRRLDIAGRPRSAEARLLEQIGLAADALMVTDDPRVAALEAQLGYAAGVFQTFVDWDGDLISGAVKLTAQRALDRLQHRDDADQTCQFPGCTAWATHRSVTLAGYRQTCGEHFRWDEPILPAEEASE